nr:AraC family transcriptional regulator [Rheinheimera oceanensis]
MVRNFTFNVSASQFAFLTGRSLSTFKRDFKTVFNDTPGNWIRKKRLEEAYFLMSTKGEKPSDIYLDLGFENLSHFSFAFKKMFGVNPKDLARLKPQV